MGITFFSLFSLFLFIYYLFIFMCHWMFLLSFRLWSGLYLEYFVSVMSNSIWTLVEHCWHISILLHGQWWSCRGACVCVFVIVCVCFGTWEITHYILACSGRHKLEILACLTPSSFSCAGNLWPLSDSRKRNERELLLSQTTTPDPFKTAPLPPRPFISENRNSVWTRTEMTD